VSDGSVEHFFRHLYARETYTMFKFSIICKTTNLPKLLVTASNATF
jgi:hypothetical protein